MVWSRAIGYVSRIIIRVSELHKAAEDGNVEEVNQLITNNASVDQPGLTPLHIVAYQSNAAIAQILFEHRADVNQSDNDDKTPLYVAVECNHEALVKLLLSRIPDLHTLNHQKIPADRQKHRLLEELIWQENRRRQELKNKPIRR